MRFTITRWKNVDANNPGRLSTLDWDRFCAEFAEAGQKGFHGDYDHPGWSPAEFSGNHRSKDDARRVFAICLDYDEGDTIDAAQAVWGGFMGLLQTTRKHTSEAHRFRVILPLTRPVNTEEFEQLWERVYAHAGRKTDSSTRDPSRFWYVPGTLTGEFEIRRFKGPPIDPDEWLARPLPAPKPVITNADLTPSDGLHPYVARALELEVSNVRNAGLGDRNNTLNRAAFALGQFVAGGALPESEVVSDLTAAALSSGLKERETSATIRSGLKHGAKHPRKAPERTVTIHGDDFDEYYAKQQAEVSEQYQEREPEPEPEPEAEPGPRKPAVELYGFLSQHDLLSMCYEAMQKPRLELGVPTGNQELDNAIGRYRRGNVTILGAKRSFGKTSCSIMTCRQAQTQAREDGEPFTVLVFAGEDSEMMYAKRFMSIAAGINATRLRDLECTDRDKADAVHAVQEAPRLPFFIRTGGRPVEWIVKVIEDVAKEQRIDLVIVDYLQCVRAKKRQQDRRNEVTYVARCCVDAIKNANAAGLLLSQLKRTERTKPEIEDLKESGDLEDMAEHILLGWKETYKDQSGQAADERRIIVAKNKDGPGDVDPILMPFDTRIACFKPTYGIRGFTRQNPDDDLFDFPDDLSRAAGDADEEMWP